MFESHLCSVSSSSVKNIPSRVDRPVHDREPDLTSSPASSFLHIDNDDGISSTALFTYDTRVIRELGDEGSVRAYLGRLSSKDLVPYDERRASRE